MRPSAHICASKPFMDAAFVWNHDYNQLLTSPVWNNFIIFFKAVLPALNVSHPKCFVGLSCKSEMQKTDVYWIEQSWQNKTCCISIYVYIYIYIWFIVIIFGCGVAGICLTVQTVLFVCLFLNEKIISRCLYNFMWSLYNVCVQHLHVVLFLHVKCGFFSYFFRDKHLEQWLEAANHLPAKVFSN